MAWLRAPTSFKGSGLATLKGHVKWLSRLLERRSARQSARLKESPIRRLSIAKPCELDVTRGRAS